MSRYIDADAIISFVDSGHLRNPLELAWSDNDVVGMIESRPTVDAVPVVRCRECKHRDPEDKRCDCGGHEWVKGKILPVKDDWFCADGERKDGAVCGSD